MYSMGQLLKFIDHGLPLIKEIFSKNLPFPNLIEGYQ